VFKPAGIPARDLEEIVMALDEFEAVRLADAEGLYQEQAAEKMGISRPTFGRILETARRKLAETIVFGKALRIEGGPVHDAGRRRLRCVNCKHEWEVLAQVPKPEGCPQCGGEHIGCQEVVRGTCGGPGHRCRGRRQRRAPETDS
jgi:predicted DNA-binding protein (UPF0251 family)